ncbi:MAG TPA: hypothetical protein VIP46_14200 [Pyrinomonadaceae bacterium]
MKIKTVVLFAALLAPAAVSAQTPPATHSPSDIVLLQKGWSAERRNPALDDDPFAANTDYIDSQRAQRMNELQNIIRSRGSESREPPVQNPSRTTDPNRPKDTFEKPKKDTQPSDNRRTIYTYRAKVKNTGAKTIRLVHWAYAFLDPDTQQPLGLHRYKTKVKIRPGESFELAGRSGAPQTSTVSVASVSKKLDEVIVIFRVEYDDGAVWEIPLK